MIVAVVGTGLIGGSAGMAARRRLGAHVRGTGRSGARAVELGALDEACDGLAQALDGADLALLCAPVDVLEDVVREVLALAPATCAVTDVGSTKRAVVAAAAGDERFVGGHPLAGAEVAGVEHAREDLFDDATWYLTPQESTGGVMLERVYRFVSGLGARPHIVGPDDHDRMMAAVSHLPHVVANVLVAQAAGALGGERLPQAGPSFRDATRVAGANPGIWTGIYRANREALLEQLDGAIAGLEVARGLLEQGDAQRLEDWQAEAGRRHRELLDASRGGGPTSELRAVVANSPGVIARIALTLGEAGINIVDLSLTPSPDNTRGSILLAVAQDRAQQAAELLRGLGVDVA